jgi:membrane protease YdiL (CAAX protease family)
MIAIQLPLLSLYVIWLKKILGNGFTIGFRLDNLGKSLLLCSSVSVILVYSTVQSIKVFGSLPVEISGMEFFTAMMNKIMLGVSPGVAEEYMYRVILMGMIMHLSKGKKNRLFLAVAFSSGIFGVIHLINIFAGASFVETFQQVFYASAAGVLFAGVYARTHNIVAPMIAHSLWDILDSLYTPFYPSLSELPLELQPVIPEEVFNIIITVLLLAAGLYLLRPSRHHEIEEHWGSLAAEKDAPM